MKLFKLTVAGLTDTTYAGTRRDIAAAAKALPKEQRIDALVQEVDVKTDKAGAVAALNGAAIETLTGNTWTLSTRGALVGA